MVDLLIDLMIDWLITWLVSEYQQYQEAGAEDEFYDEDQVKECDMSLNLLYMFNSFFSDLIFL